MKSLVFLTVIALVTLGASPLRKTQVSFSSIGKTLTITGSISYKLHTLIEDKSYELIGDNSLDWKVPIDLIEGFRFPDRVERDVAEFYGKLKAPVSYKKAEIKTEKHLWGVEYWWSTPTKGSAKYSYLCAKKAITCIRVISGINDDLKFEIR